MLKRVLTLLIALTTVAVAAGCLVVARAETKEQLPSKSDQSCLKCHEYDKAFNILAGKFVDVSTKAKSLQLQIDKDMEVIFFDDSTVLKKTPSLREIPKQESVRVVYGKKDGKLFAE